MARFSSRVVPRAWVTCRSQDLPKMVTTGGPASTSAWMLLSSGGRTPGRRVEPKAVILADLNTASCTRLKKRRSLGLEPGHPPSVVDAECVEPLGDADLVLHGEGHALALGAVAEGSVVDLDLPGHGTAIIALPRPGCQVWAPLQLKSPNSAASSWGLRNERPSSWILLRHSEHLS